MIISIQLSLQHFINWAPIILWLVIIAYKYLEIGIHDINHIETQHQSELMDYYDTMHVHRKMKKATGQSIQMCYNNNMELKKRIMWT